MKDSIKKRYVIKLLANIIGTLINAIIIAIVPKALGPLAYGHFIYLQSFFAKLIGFLDMGTSMAFFTKLSARNSRKELLEFYFLYVLMVFFLMFIFIFFVDMYGYAEAFLPNIPNKYIYFGLFYGFFTWLTQIFVKISDAYALTVSIELIKIIHKLFFLVLLLFLVQETTFDLIEYFYYHFAAFISFLFVLLFLFVKKGVFINLRFKINNIALIIKEFIEYSHPLFVYSILGLIAGMFDIWMLQKVAGSEQTGFYGLAYGLAAICFLFTGSMTPIITREFSKSYEEKNMQQMKQLFYRYIPMLYSIAAFFSVFISIQSENVLIIFADENFREAVFVLMIMALYPIHQTYGQLSGSIFYAAGQTKLIRNIALLTMPAGIFCTFIFVYILNLGAVGLAYKMIVIQLIGVNIQLYFNSKFLNFNMKYFILHQLYSVAFFVILALTATFVISFDSSLAEFLVSGFVYTILVIIFTYIFPQVFAIDRNEIESTVCTMFK